MTTISVIINARTKSSRLPRKLVLPFAGSTMIDIALEKLNRMDFFTHRYYAVAEVELKQKAVIYRNIQVLDRDPDAVQPGYNDHQKIFAHYARVESDYIMWLNPCHPLLSLDTLRRAVEKVLVNKYNSYTSVVPTTDWIFDEQGCAVTNTRPDMLSSAHSPNFFKVAHAFHVIRKEFFLKEHQIWTLTKNDPALIEIPVEESYDVNDELEFEVAQAAYLRHCSRDALNK